MFKTLKRAKDQAIVGTRTAMSSAGLMLFKAKSAISNNHAEGYVDTAVKILMAVVIGALVLGGLYSLFGETVLPTLTERIKEMFNYGG